VPAVPAAPTVPATIGDLRALQRTAGNHAVSRLVAGAAGSSRPPVVAASPTGTTGRDDSADADRDESLRPGPVIRHRTPGDRDVVQRKVGFEFQTGNNFIGRPGEPEGPRYVPPHLRAVPIVREKEVAYRDSTLHFKVEGDQGPDARHFNIEFITDPQDDVGLALKAVTGASQLAEQMARRRDRHDELLVARDTSMLSGTWVRPALMEITDPGFNATPQGSVGVALDQLPSFISDAAANKWDRPHAAASAEDLHRLDPDTRLPAAVRGLLQMVALYIRLARVPPRKPGRDSRPDEIFGDTYDHRLFPDGPEELITDGPKAKFFIMARTDFHQMFLSLSDEERAAFGRIVQPAERAEEVENTLGRRWDESLISGRYRADPDVYAKMDGPTRALYDIRDIRANSGNRHPVVFRGPTIRDWLRSIVTGHGFQRGTDLGVRHGDVLSAPPGWGSRAPERKGTLPTSQEITQNAIYGMGAYPMDRPLEQERGGLAILELRALLDNLDATEVAAKYWPDMAEEVIGSFMRVAPLQR
jgi:hypothetical protein